MHFHVSVNILSTRSPKQWLYLLHRSIYLSEAIGLSDMSLDSNLKQNVALDDPRCPFKTYNSFINGAENLKQLR